MSHLPKCQLIFLQNDCFLSAISIIFFPKNMLLIFLILPEFADRFMTQLLDTFFTQVIRVSSVLDMGALLPYLHDIVMKIPQALSNKLGTLMPKQSIPQVTIILFYIKRTSNRHTVEGNIIFLCHFQNLLPLTNFNILLRQ